MSAWLVRTEIRVTSHDVDPLSGDASIWPFPLLSSTVEAGKLSLVLTGTHAPTRKPSA